MNRAVVLMGQEGEYEFYQLLVDTNYTTGTYRESIELREKFLETLAREFAERISSETRSPVRVDFLDGHLLDYSGIRFEVDKVGKDKERVLYDVLNKKLSQIGVRVEENSN